MLSTTLKFTTEKQRVWKCDAGKALENLQKYFEMLNTDNPDISSLYYREIL